MRPLSSIRIHHWPFALSAMFLLVAGFQEELRAQSAAATDSQSFELLQKKWTNAPDAELLGAAQAGDAGAQYFYWSREFRRAHAEADLLSAQSSSNFYRLSAEQARQLAEQEKSPGKWDTATDAELEQAVKSGDKLALRSLARRKQRDAYERSVKLFDWLQKSADQGLPVAEAEAALHYLRLSGWAFVEIDQPRGLELLRRAADHGVAGAQYQLAKIYLRGELLPPDISKAIEYFRRAADQGGPQSEYELASLYANGCGVPRDEADSPVALLRKSAAEANVFALHDLAERYRIGLGVPVDYILAIQYYQQARRLRDRVDRISDDLTRLVDADFQPKPELPKDLTFFARAAGIFLKAEYRGDVAAMNQIGEWYLGSRFAPRDIVEAFRWFNLAAQRGDADASRQRDKLKPMLDPGQLEQALQPPFKAEAR